MKQKIYQSLEDLLNSKSFSKWVRHDLDADVKFWEEWAGNRMDRQQMVEDATLILDGLPFEIKATPISDELLKVEHAKLEAKLNSKYNSTAKEDSSLKIKSLQNWKFVLRIAAILIAIPLMGLLLQNYVLNPMVVHKTNYGKQLAISLPDSTSVMLNANSRLTYRKNQPRKVWLQGEAFFNVQKKKETNENFLVLTNDLVVEVLGTSFNVFEKKDQTEVILEEGLVKLNLNMKEENEIFMKPGEIVAFSSKSKRIKEARVDEKKALTSWKDGVLEFDDELLEVVMERIENIYGWKAEFKNEELKSRKISIPLPSDDLGSVLQLLKEAIGVKIEKIEDKTTLLIY